MSNEGQLFKPSTFVIFKRSVKEFLEAGLPPPEVMYSSILSHLSAPYEVLTDGVINIWGAAGHADRGIHSFHTRNRSETGLAYEWIKFNLGGEKVVKTVTMYRSQFNTNYLHRNQNYTISLLDADDNVIEQKTGLAYTGSDDIAYNGNLGISGHSSLHVEGIGKLTTTFTNNIKSSKVRIENHTVSNDNNIVLSEVEIFAEYIYDYIHLPLDSASDINTIYPYGVSVVPTGSVAYINDATRGNVLDLTAANSNITLSGFSGGTSSTDIFIYDFYYKHIGSITGRYNILGYDNYNDGAGGGDGVWILYMFNGDLQLYKQIGGGDTQVLSQTGLISQNIWHHIQLKIYSDSSTPPELTVDGTTYNGTGTIGVTPSTYSIMIGDKGGLHNEAVGYYDEFKVLY